MWLQPLRPKLAAAAAHACATIEQLKQLEAAGSLTAADEDLLLAASQVIDMAAKARKAAAPQQQCPPTGQVLRSLLNVGPTLPVHVHRMLLIPVVQGPHEIRVL